MLKFIKNSNHLEQYALWLFMFLFVFDYHFWEDNWLDAIQMTSIELSLYLLIFYVNYKVVIPLLLEKGKQTLYILVLFLFLVSYIFLLKTTGLEYLLYEGAFWRNALSMTINFSLFWLISTLSWYYKKLQKERETQLQLKAEKLETELRFLKSQISPHFIFNTLNNIYALVQQGHKNAAPMLAQLSTILRYILYDSARDQVFLSKEIATIQEYIQLQLYRKSKSSNIDFYQEGKLNGLQIAPLMLLNFVENCFKHSNIDTNENGWIKISCMVHDGHIELITENSTDKIIQKNDIGGIGTQNVIRQLELKYKDKHSLNTKKEDGVFIVRLTIELNHKQ